MRFCLHFIFVVVVSWNFGCGSSSDSKTAPMVTPAIPGPITAGTSVSNSLGMKFMGVPSGSFRMGLGDGDLAKTTHMVKISEGFYMGRTEVTQREWKAVMGSLPAGCTGGRFFEQEFIGDNKPVVCVSWDDAHNFIRKLNARGDATYRLPTEAEWEYACRAGTTTKYSFGDDESALDNYAWHYSNSRNETHEVATKLPNAWGLHDIHGNVSEWCEDWHGAYPDGSATDPKGPTTGSDRLIRGGNFYTIPGGLRSGDRFRAPHDDRGSHVGFRVLITLLPSKSDIR